MTPLPSSNTPNVAALAELGKELLVTRTDEPTATQQKFVLAMFEHRPISSMAIQKELLKRGMPIRHEYVVQILWNEYKRRGGKC